MKGSKDLLSSILKTTQAGQTGIRSIMNRPLNENLKAALHSGMRIGEICALRFGDIDSKAASMMVTGNTRGIIKGYKNLNQYNNSDAAVGALARKLLDCEKENIQQMQGFL